MFLQSWCMNNITNIRRLCRVTEITIIAWILLAQNIAGNLKRHMYNNILANAMLSSHLDCVIEQWFFRVESKVTNVIIQNSILRVPTLTLVYNSFVFLVKIFVTNYVYR